MINICETCALLCYFPTKNDCGPLLKRLDTPAIYFLTLETA